jgi:cell wall-associated NlpC family hydrolase
MLDSSVGGGGVTIDNIDFNGAFSDIEPRLKRNPKVFVQTTSGSSYTTVLDQGVVLTQNITTFVKNESLIRSVAGLISSFSLLGELIGASNGSVGGAGSTELMSADAASIIAYAKEQLGKPYVFGSQGPDTFDCSGLMYYVFKKFGIHVTPQTEAGKNEGMAVDIANIQPADIVYFASEGNVHHVGLYIGNGQYLHAPHTGDVVKISNLADRNDIYCVRRMIK